MSDEAYSFSTARVRLEEIVSQVRKKDTSLEKSLDLLEEGVRLANICTELVDHTDLSATAAAPDDSESRDAGDAGVAETSAAAADAGASDEVDGGPDEPAGIDDGIEDVEGGATEEYDGLDA